jgi:hypothetical protein
VRRPKVRPGLNQSFVVAGRTEFVPGALPLAIAAAVITVVTVTLVLVALRVGRLLERLDERRQGREQRAIVERTRRYGQAAGSGTTSVPARQRKERPF